MDATSTLERHRVLLPDPNVVTRPLESGRLDDYSPLGFEAGDDNLYRFVGNDPVDETDPTGEQAHPLSKPTDPNAIDSPRWNALVVLSGALNGHVSPSTPIGKIPFNDYFENAVNRMLGMSKYKRSLGPQFNLPARAAYPNGRLPVEPDAVASVTEFSNKKMPMVYPNSMFVDAKHGNIYLRMSLYYYEPVGYADVLSRSPVAKAGGLPLMLYVTTADARISQMVVDKFTINRVLVAQSYMAYDAITKKLYLTPPIFLNAGLQKRPRSTWPPVSAPLPQFPLDWSLIKPF